MIDGTMQQTVLSVWGGDNALASKVEHKIQLL